MPEGERFQVVGRASAKTLVLLRHSVEAGEAGKAGEASAAQQEVGYEVRG